MKSQTKIESNVVVTVTNPTRRTKKYYGSNTVTSKLLAGIVNYLSTSYNDTERSTFGVYLPSLVRLGTGTTISAVTNTDLESPAGDYQNLYYIRADTVDGDESSMQVMYRAQFDVGSFEPNIELHEAGLFGPFTFDSESESHNSELLARVILTDDEGNGIRQISDSIIDVQWTIKISAVINN